MSQELGRFGHHPDPAIDFCVEVEALQAIARSAVLRLSGFGHEDDRQSYSDRYRRAMDFQVGGDAGACNAKHELRALPDALLTGGAA